MSSIQVGDILEGRYSIEAPIASGGMSTVYRSVDLRLGRYVAAKVMHQKYVNDPVFRQRFRREARSMAKLSHPNLVGVYDFSSDGENVFLIMELITGGTLRELLAERGPMPPHAATAVMKAVLTGLEAAHAKGMVHRDIKPDNVLINGDHQVKLADFGLVRAASASAATSNQIVGTVSYLSPEQVTGDDITPASDVYSAGILLFELLTGERPFDGDSQLAHAYARLDRDVPAPSTRIGGVPRAFDELVAIATARDPQDRFEDAGEFLTALNDAASQLRLPSFTVPVPKNSAAHRASEGLNEHAHNTELFTTDISPDVHNPQAEGLFADLDEPTTRVFEKEAADRRANREEEHGLPSLGSPETRQFGVPTPPVPPQVPSRAPSPIPVSSPPPAPQRRPAQPARVARQEPKVSNRNKTGFIAWLITVALFTTAVAIGAWWFGSGRYGEIPQVLGMDEVQAVAVVEDAGFGVIKEGVYSDNVAPNQLVGTQPGFGERAVKGDNITLLVSLGQPTVPEIPSTPSVAAMKAALKERTLTMVPGGEEYSDTVDEGDVVRVEPKPGDTVPVGSSVTVFTSKGAAPVNMPHLSGTSEDKARKQLEGLGLVVTVEHGFSPDEESGDVFATEPPAGTSLTKGSTVILKVSTAIEIPDVVGDSESQAKRKLADAGLRVGDVTRSTTESAKNIDDVVGTSPEAGSLVDPSQTDITIVLAGNVDVPYVVGKRYSEAREILRDAGFDYEVISGRSSADALVITQSPLTGDREAGTTVQLRLIGG